MAIYDASLGVLMIGTWANAMLFMMELIQAFRYFSLYPEDKRSIRVLVTSLVTVDATCTAATMATVYLYCVTFWGDVAGLSQEYWSYPLYCITTGLSSTIGQTFLATRFYSLSRNRFIAAILGCLIITSLSGSIYAMIILILFPTLSDRNRLPKPVIIWFTSSTACDIIITVSLVWLLHRVDKTSSHTDTMLRHLIRLAISTGSVTSIWALVVMSVFVHNPNSNVAVAFNFCFGRVYALTVLYNLNQRRAISASEPGSEITDPLTVQFADRGRVGSSQFYVSKSRNTQVSVEGDKRTQIRQTAQLEMIHEASPNETNKSSRDETIP